MTKTLIQACKDTLAQTLGQHSFDTAYKKTFELIHANTPELKDRTYRMRHKISCEEHGHECPTAPGSYLECDEFDDMSEHFILKHRISNEMVGSLRVVLPNDESPSASFPLQKYCDHPLLKFDEKALRLCEISRFCTAKRFRKRKKDGRYLSAYSPQDIIKAHESGKMRYIRRRIPYTQAALLQGAFEIAMKEGILDCLWMVEPEHLESLQQIGFSYRILGPKLDVHGGMQPLIFNIKHVLDNMKHNAPHCWVVISDNGRLQKTADELAQNCWHDNLMDQACQDMIYRKLTR